MACALWPAACVLSRPPGLGPCQSPAPALARPVPRLKLRVPAVLAIPALVEHALRNTLVADALSLQFRLPPTGASQPTAKSQARACSCSRWSRRLSARPIVPAAAHGWRPCAGGRLHAPVQQQPYPPLARACRPDAALCLLQPSLGGGAPCVQCLVITSVWTVNVLRLLASVCPCACVQALISERSRAAQTTLAGRVEAALSCGPAAHAGPRSRSLHAMCERGVVLAARQGQQVGRPPPRADWPGLRRPRRTGAWSRWAWRASAQRPAGRTKRATPSATPACRPPSWPLRQRQPSSPAVQTQVRACNVSPGSQLPLCWGMCLSLPCHGRDRSCQPLYQQGQIACIGRLQVVQAAHADPLLQAAQARPSSPLAMRACASGPPQSSTAWGRRCAAGLCSQLAAAHADSTCLAPACRLRMHRLRPPDGQACVCRMGQHGSGSARRSLRRAWSGKALGRRSHSAASTSSSRCAPFRQRAWTGHTKRCLRGRVAPPRAALGPWAHHVRPVSAERPAPAW